MDKCYNNYDCIKYRDGHLFKYIYFMKVFKIKKYVYNLRRNYYGRKQSNMSL